MRKNFRGFLLFTFAVVTLTIILRILNWLPLYMEEGLLQRYSTIEDVRAKLKFKELLVPSYFPQQFKWPPYEILAQTKPFTFSVMKFRRFNGKPDALVISQSEYKAPVPDCFPVMSQVKESTAYNIKGRQALLEVGNCGHGEACSRIQWVEGIYRINVAAYYSSPFELISISESMIH